MNNVLLVTPALLDRISIQVRNYNGLTSIANGQTAGVRGLVFNDRGMFRMVASRIVNP